MLVALAVGLAIFAHTAFSLAVVVALWRQPFADRSLGWALRLGMALSASARPPER